MSAQGVWRPLCASREIIEISSLGWRPRAQPIYHARSYTTSVLLFSCQRPVRETLLLSRFLAKASSTKCLKLPIKQKKRAAFFGGRPLLETGMLFQDGQVTSRAS